MSTEVQKTNENENTDSYPLIVNYLPQSINENQLNELFSKIGKLKYCKVIRDNKTGYSFGFAFLEYLNGEEHGRLACEQFNQFEIGHKRIQVTKARPQSNETRNTKLYVKGFPDSFDENDFLNLFSKFGEIIQIRILKEKLICFIIMSTRTEAENAKTNLHDYQIDSSNKLHVEFSHTNSKRKHFIQQVPCENYSYSFHFPQFYFSFPTNSNLLYVYGLKQSVTKNDLRDLFSQFGNVIRVDLIFDNNTGLSKGYAFILMEQYSQAFNAIQQLNNQLFHGRFIQVRFRQNNLSQINY